MTLELDHQPAVSLTDDTDSGRGLASGEVKEKSTSLDRVDDLAQIIRAYNQVTENLQRSHESLRGEVTRLREELASADAQLQRSKRLAALGEMAAGIAHEIRNPLGAIQLYAEMLRTDLANGHADSVAAANPGAGAGLHAAGGDALQMLGTAKKIESAVRGLNGIVNDVLSFARELKPRREEVAVAALLARAIEGYQAGIEQAGVLASCTTQQGGDNGTNGTASDAPLTVWADAELLHQALVNLIRNAVEWMTKDCHGDDAGPVARNPQTHPTRLLTLSGRRDDASVVLTVRDTGPGIAEQDIDRIFNPFFTTRSTGTGLGLAIVHRIVDAHGGAISVYNDPGAVFELRFPAGPPSGPQPSREGRPIIHLMHSSIKNSPQASPSLGRGPR